MSTTELVVALDYNDQKKAQALIKSLGDLPVIYKIGLELYLSADSQWTHAVCASGRRVFLDLKFHDIPNTVAKAAAQACELGVEMFTLHVAGGQEMIAAAAAELKKAKSRPTLLGVTVLTSFDEAGWRRVTNATSGQNPKGQISEAVERLATAGASWGLTGLVCSAHELPLVRKAAPDLYTVVPGIRPTGSNAQDQARVLTPAEAARAGARAIVVGRPITQAPKPIDAIQSILKELKEV